MADEEQKEQTAAKPEVKKSKTADMKKVLGTLREQKNEARQNKDPKRVDVLRRRINRMKKRTKKLAKA